MKNVEEKKHAKYVSFNRQYLYSAHRKIARVKQRLPKRNVSPGIVQKKLSPHRVIYIFSVYIRPKRRQCGTHIQIRCMTSNCISSMTIGDNEMCYRSIATSTNSMLEMQKHYSRATSSLKCVRRCIPHSPTFALGPSKFD